MTQGEKRAGQRAELAAILADCVGILDDERVVDRPRDLDAVAMALSVAMPLADNLAQTPKPRRARPLAPLATFAAARLRYHLGGEIAEGFGATPYHAD